ncbi:MAG: CBS domain-containing protein [Candidatus Altiarchaeota archaeon]
MTAVKDVMSETVFAADPEMTIVEAAKKMAKEGIGSLVVLHKEEIVGIITERDMFRKIIAQEKDYRELQVKDVMTSPTLTIKPTDSLNDASKIMAAQEFRRLPVVDEGKLVGIVTETDLWLRMTEETIDNLKKDVLSGDIPKVVEEYVKKVTELNQQHKKDIEAMKAKNEELKEMNKFMVDRELKMIELKERVKELEEQK